LSCFILLSAERQCTIFRRLGVWLKGKEYVTLDCIFLPDEPDNPATTWTSVIEAQALYEVLLAAGQKNFNQAADTPFATGPVADKLGPFADNDYCDAILQGTVDIEALADLTKVQDLIQGMRYPNPLNPTMMISSTISEQWMTSQIL
jgi:hypothetical protein